MLMPTKKPIKMTEEEMDRLRDQIEEHRLEQFRAVLINALEEFGYQARHDLRVVTRAGQYRIIPLT